MSGPAGGVPPFLALAPGLCNPLRGFRQEGGKALTHRNGLETAGAATDRAASGWFGHPRGLYVLFFTEMWERFSYYGMRALLILYLTKHWLFSDQDASLVYGTYTALVYIAPVIGGYLADRWLGQRKAVVFGALLLTFGHMLMAVEGDGGQTSPVINVFWLALSFIIVGSGFLKANISVMVGALYAEHDIRRDGAYTIFYVGINTGALIGTLVAGWLGETWGWSWGFGAAGVGMLTGLVVFLRGRRFLEGHGEPPDGKRLRQRTAGLSLEWLIYLSGFALVVASWLLIQAQELVGDLLGLTGAVLLAYVLYTCLVKLPRVAFYRILAAIYLMLGSILFWALFEQAGSSLNLFADRHVARGGIPASVFQSVNPFFIMTLGPLFAWGWTRLARLGREPSTPAKFAIGVVLLGSGFLVLDLGANPTGLTPIAVLVLLYMLHTMGELCLSPVGLSAMTRLAPPQMASLIMGAWFLAAAAGNYASGVIAAATGAGALEDGLPALSTILSVYRSIGWLAVGVGVAMLVAAPFVARLMHLDDDAAGKKT